MTRATFPTWWSLTPCMVLLFGIGWGLTLRVRYLARTPRVVATAQLVGAR